MLSFLSLDPNDQKSLEGMQKMEKEESPTDATVELDGDDMEGSGEDGDLEGSDSEAAQWADQEQWFGIPSHWRILSQVHLLTRCSRPNKTDASFPDILTTLAATSSSRLHSCIARKTPPLSDATLAICFGASSFHLCWLSAAT